MRILVALSLLCVSTCSVSASVCSDGAPGNECRESCEGFGTQIFTFGNFGCISTPDFLCCKASETTTALPTTTPEPTTTTETTTTGPPTTTEEPTTTTLPPAQQCGISNSADITGRILNGQTTTAACDWPWLVSILGKTSPTDTFFDAKPVCTGVLIDKKWVLTTAYCASKAAIIAGGISRHQNVFVVAGEHDIRAGDYTGFERTEKFAGVSRIILHDDYVPNDVNAFTGLNVLDGGNTGSNLALLELSLNFTFSDCVRQVCLPTDQARRKRQAECPVLTKECWTASWGSLGGADATKLQEAQVTIISQEVWNVHSMIKGSSYTGKPLTSHGVFQNDTVRACTDDNGGMVVCKQPGESQWTLEGLINRPGFADCTSPLSENEVTLTDVRAANQWITDNMSPV